MLRKRDRNYETVIFSIDSSLPIKTQVAQTTVTQGGRENNSTRNRSDLSAIQSSKLRWRVKIVSLNEL